MFAHLRSIAEAVRELRRCGDDIRDALLVQAAGSHEGTALSDRVAAVEIGYAKWEAEAEATMLRADALFKNARNAEERARDMKKKASAATEGSVEGEEAIRDAYRAAYGVPEGDVNGVPPTRLPEVREDLAPVARAELARSARLRAKFG